MKTRKRVSLGYGRIVQNTPAERGRQLGFGKRASIPITLTMLAALFVPVLAVQADPTCRDWLPITSVAARSGHAMAYDSARGVTVLFGGSYYDGTYHYLSDTWEWDGTTWTRRTSATSPSARAYHAMVYDSARGVTVLFGGSYQDSDYHYLADTWEWNGAAWTQRSTATSPSERAGHAMTYDIVRGVALLFGGSGGYDDLNDTWEWTGMAWTQLTPATSPSARSWHAMAYDSFRGVTVLFGGYYWYGLLQYLGDTWEWDGTTWAQRSTANSPSARGGHTVTYDSARGAAVLFGGYYFFNGSEDYFDDTWEWDGISWTQCSPAKSPSARHSPAMAYDSARGVAMLFGGYGPGHPDRDDGWEWNGTAWTATSPPARTDHAMVYDSARGAAVLFGGHDDRNFRLGDSWEWDGTIWTQHSPVVGPSARWGHAMAYDGARAVTVLFGGYGSTYPFHLGDTWERDGTTWMQRSPATDPPARYGHAMAYDSARSVTVLFGGGYYGGTGHTLGDTWEWDGTTWTERNPVASPPARSSHAMTFDSARSVIVLFGGYGAVTPYYLADTWEWDGTTWTQRSPATSPPARTHHATVYDTAHGVTVLFGGRRSGSPYYLGDTWEWDGATWTERSPTTSPSARWGCAMAYDISRGVTVLFGGRDDSDSPFYILSDTWELSTHPVDGDLNLSGRADGADISSFVSAVLNASTLPLDLCHADFNSNRVIDVDDLPGFTQKLLGP